MTNALTDMLQKPVARSYLITGGVEPVDRASFEEFLRKHPSVNAFWNYLPGVYFVKSAATADQLAMMCKDYYLTRNFIVIEVQSGNMNGSLPPTAWQWFSAPVQNALMRNLFSGPVQS